MKEQHRDLTARVIVFCFIMTLFLIAVGLLRASPVCAEGLQLLRTWGEAGPDSKGRFISVGATIATDGNSVTVRGFAYDGTNAVTEVELRGGVCFVSIFAPTCQNLATCLADDPRGTPCAYVWPTANMLAGNNDIMVITTHAPNAAGAILRYMTAGKIARPVPGQVYPGPPDFLTDGDGQPLLAR